MNIDMKENLYHVYYAYTQLTPRDIYITQYGEQQCSPSYSFGPAVRNHFILHYVYSGKGKLVIRDKTYHIHQGQFFIIYPGQSAYYKADKNNPWLYRWIEFNGDFAKVFMESAGFSKNNSVNDDDEKSSVGNAIKTLISVGETSFEHIMSLFWNTISILTNGSMNNKKLTRTELYISAAENYIKSNIHKKVTVQEVADFLGISRNHLSRIYKQATETTIQQYIISIKLDTAAQYLKNTDLSIGEIASNVGYSDSLEFSKVFKKYFNVSPSQWRNKLFWQQSIKLWPK